MEVEISCRLVGKNRGRGVPRKSRRYKFIGTETECFLYFMLKYKAKNW